MPSTQAVLNVSDVLNKAGERTTVSLRSIVVRGLNSAFAKLNPGEKIKQNLSYEHGLLRWKNKIVARNIESIYAIAIGSLAEEMMLGLLEAIKESHLFEEGLVTISFAGHQRLKTPKVQVYRSNPQFFDGNAVRVSKAAISLLSKASGNDVVFFLLSPGARTMLAKPKEPLTPSHLEEVRFKLSRAGATPLEISNVLVHLDEVKGGQLAKINPLPIQITLAVGDVADHELEVVGDGPTTPNPSSFEDAVEILQFYGVWEKLDHKIKNLLNRGLKKEIPETPKPGEKGFSRSSWHLLSNTKIFCETLKEEFFKAGRISSVILTDNFVSDPSSIGRLAATFTRAKGLDRPYALIMAGRIQSRRVVKDSPATDAAIAAMPSMTENGKDVLVFLDTAGKDGHSEYSGIILTPEKVHPLLKNQTLMLKIRGGFAGQIFQEQGMNINIKEGLGAYGHLVLVLSGTNS